MRPSSPTLHGALRGVLVNPWFAAGASLVIAASMWLYAPQTQLSFPHEAIGRTKCQVQGCAPMVTAPDGGSVATSSGQPISPSVRRHARRQATADVQTKSGSLALAFGYSVVSRHRRRFALELTVTSSKPITNWTLSFAMDGDRIRSVFGANWQPASTDSGAASGLVSADGGQGGGGQGGGGQGGGGQGGGGQGGGGQGGDRSSRGASGASASSGSASGASGAGASGAGASGDRGSGSGGAKVSQAVRAARSGQQFSISFIVIGTGPLVAPSDCFFNGESCIFSSAAAG